MTYRYEVFEMLSPSQTQATLSEYGHGGWRLVPDTWHRLSTGYTTFAMEKAEEEE